jgi:NAD-dependent SIR2 family protein deacetylase
VKDFPKCDLLIVMGTSLQVQPFASLTRYPKKGTPRLLINRERVGDFNSKSPQDVIMLGDCDHGCIRLAKALGWEADLKELIQARD